MLLICPGLLALGIFVAKHGDWRMGIVLSIIAIALAFNAVREIVQWLERI
jgi:hypothetical protein